MDAAELKADCTIDPGQLDVEAVRQADLYFKWSERAIVAKTAVDEAEFAVDVLEARLQMQARENPGKFGITAATETAIKSAVKASNQYADAMHTYFRLAEEHARLDKAAAAMDDKRGMIEALCKLHGQQYFAGPSVPRDLVAAWQQHQQSGPTGIGAKQAARARRRGED